MSESRFVKDKNNLSINSHCNCGLCRRAVYRPEILIVESSERVKRLFVHILCLPIRFYQVFISPLFPPCCRYYPTCSSYALEAIKKHGPLKGTFMATKRILRCNPFHEGGYDPVP